MRNNNREIIRLLAKREYDSKKGRNRILTGAAALAVLMVFGVFSLAAGKIQTDYLLYIRNFGTAASTVLEAPSEEQYRQIQSLSYIRHVGKETVFGETKAFSCAVLDQPAWEKLQKPAYTDIHGNYPQELYEVMLPVRALQEMGIDSPKVGMKIPLEMEVGEGKVIKEEFQLSGYYTEYVDPAMSLPYGYFSEKYLQEGLQGKGGRKEQESPLEQNFAVTLLIQQDTGIDGETAEEWLYRDIPMTNDSQQFFGGNAMTLEAVTELAGGYDMACFMAAVIFLFAWLLIYNILFVSMQQDIRRFGLLQTLGTTTKQIRRIVFLQVSRCACKGCFIGALAGIFLAVVLMPGILSGMYLQGLGNASAMIAFRPWILAASVFFGAGVTYLSSLAAMIRFSGLSAVESAKYMEKASPRPFHRAWKMHSSVQDSSSAFFWKKAGAPGHKMFIPASMAWGNLFRFRRRACLTIVSLALGLCVSLGAVVISQGTDTTNQIEYEYYDFEMISNMSVLTAGAYPELEEIFPKSLVQKIAGLKGIEELQQVKGGFGCIRMDEKAFELRMENIAQGEELKEGFCSCVVQEVSLEYLQELKEFSEEKQLFLDLAPVIEGTGAIMLHYNLFSQAEKEKSRDYAGSTFTMYDLFGEKTEEMTFCGYLNFKEKGLPELETTWNGPNVIYFLVSEEGLEHMQIPSQTFLLLLNVKQEKEPVLKNTLARIINEHNRQFAAKAAHEAYVTDSRTITLQAKSDLLASARNYIASSRVVMSVLCLILLFMGLMNYVNVTAVGLALRQREFAVLESIGMTKKQQRALILWEGILYSFFIGVLTLAAGSGIWYGIGRVMKSRIAYFRFAWPWMELLCSVAGLFAICILIPFLLYGKHTWKTTAERKNFAHTSDIS